MEFSYIRHFKQEAKNRKMGIPTRYNAHENIILINETNQFTMVAELKDNVLHVGFAFVSKNDAFAKKKGVAIAKTRLKPIYEYNITNVFREKYGVVCFIAIDDAIHVYEKYIKKLKKDAMAKAQAELEAKAKAVREQNKEIKAKRDAERKAKFEASKK